MSKKNQVSTVKAAGTSQGAQAGHGTRATTAAEKASAEAHEASAAAHSPMGGNREHAEAAQLHQDASNAHEAAMVAHAKAGNSEKAAEHAKAMCAHDAACEAHGGTAPDAAQVEACENAVGELVKAHEPGSVDQDADEAADLANDSSMEAFEASARAHESGEDEDHGEAKEAHQKARDAHKVALIAHAKVGDGKAAEDHAIQMNAHDRCRDAHDRRDSESVAACLKDKGISVKAATPQPSDTVHCRAESGSKLPASEPWSMEKPVDFMYMPAGVHTINAGFRNGSINLTIQVDPQRDASVCQASLEQLTKETPKQKAFGCFEHEEKTASVWANRFLPKGDGIYLEATPSKAGADAVNGRNHRSWSPSFNTDAEYGKCQCRSCDKGVKACECEKPSLYFPEGAKGSASNPAKIAGVDFCLGTLTNKPAFRAISPVKAKQVVQAEENGHAFHGNQYTESTEVHVKDIKKGDKVDLGSGHREVVKVGKEKEENRGSKQYPVIVKTRDIHLKNGQIMSVPADSSHPTKILKDGSSAHSERMAGAHADSAAQWKHNSYKADATSEKSSHSANASESANESSKHADGANTAQAHLYAADAHGAAADAHRDLSRAYQNQGDHSLAEVHHGKAVDHNEKESLHLDRAIRLSKNKASEQHEASELDTILAHVQPIESVDQILSRIPGTVGGFAAELEAAEQIFARISGGK